MTFKVSVSSFTGEGCIICKLTYICFCCIPFIAPSQPVASYIIWSGLHQTRIVEGLENNLVEFPLKKLKFLRVARMRRGKKQMDAISDVHLNKPHRNKIDFGHS